MPARKVVQIAAAGTGALFYALADDGTVWWFTAEQTWEQLPSLPEPTPALPWSPESSPLCAWYISCGGDDYPCVLVKGHRAGHRGAVVEAYGCRWTAPKEPV